LCPLSRSRPCGLTAPSLNGNRFVSAWENENLYKLFVKVRDTMPPNFGTILTDEAKLDVVTVYSSDQRLPDRDAGTKGSMPKLSKTFKSCAREPRKSSRTFPWCESSVAWHRVRTIAGVLSDATDPVLSRDQASTQEELQRAQNAPAGKQRFRLVNVADFDPSSIWDTRLT
jgi:hypothetical protein